MSRHLVVSLAFLLLAANARAQSVATHADTPARGGPPLALALEAAQTAVSTCAAGGNKVTALVVDYHGSLIALLSGDGASYKTPEFAGYKAATVMKFKVASRVISDKADKDPALAAELKADPKIGAAHIGGLPIVIDGQVIGAIAVSGSAGGDKDEGCAQAGLDKIASRLH